MNAELLLQKEELILQLEELILQKEELFLAGKVTLEKGVPLVHAIDLMLVLTLTRALRQVSLGPLAVTSCDLLCAFSRVLTVVTIEVIVVTSFTLGSTMGKLILIVESAPLVTTGKVTLHTTGIGFEFCNP